MKKLLFAMSILRLDNQNIVKQVFVKRAKLFHENEGLRINQNKSPTFSILNCAIKAGVYNILHDITIDNTPAVSKCAWSKLIWSKAWEIEDLFWKSTEFLNKNNDLLYKSISSTRYLPWWELSDKFPWLMKNCETMARLICHASKLKSDDVRLKSLTLSHRICPYCDLYIVEDLYHVVMQCPGSETHMREMLDKITRINETIKSEFERNPNEVFAWLIGKDAPNIGREDMYKVWIISSEFIAKKYNQICKDRSGIG